MSAFPPHQHSMRIDPFVRNLEKFRDDLAAALNDPATRLYLDTSTLMWLARLSRGARADFINWSSERNVVVPVWVAHEFQRHLLNGTVKSNMHKILKEAQSKQREFAQIATEQADDALCAAKGFGLRETYISEVQRHMASLTNLGRVIEADDERLKVGAEEVVAFANKRMLNSDLDSIISELSSTGQFRLSHRVPPGYQDAHKAENPLGDAVVWREILDDVEALTRTRQRQWFQFARPKAAGPMAGVLISRDQKTDWLSTAPLVRMDEKTVVKPDADLGFEVDLPHPLLGHEFERKGGGTFFLVHPGALSRVVEDMEVKANIQSKTAAWRGASLRPDVLEKLENRAAQEARRQAKAAGRSNPPPTPSAVVAAGHSASPAAAPVQPPSPGIAAVAVPASTPKVDLGSLEATHVMKGAISAEAGAYRLADADQRATLLDGWCKDVRSGSFSASRLGRIICAASLQEAGGRGVAQVPALLETLRRMVPDHAEPMLLGALCSAFFDEQGGVRKRPQTTLATVLLSLEQIPWAVSAFAALAALLTRAGASLPYIPGSRSKVKVKVDLEKATTSQPPMLLRVLVGGHDVLADVSDDEHPRRLSTILSVADDQKCKPSTLVALISREYIVPRDLIDASGLGDKDFSWRSDAGLCPMDTSGSGGIGLIEDEDF